MKICPKCGKTYTDASLNFCLDDGTVLNQTGANLGSSALPKTVLINQPRQTSANPQFGSQTENQNWAAPARISPAAAKSSGRTWLWALGILGAVVLLCGGGLAGLLVLGSMAEDDPEWNSNFAANSVSNTTADTNRASNSLTERANVTKIDLSAWVRDNSQYGKTIYRGGELLMNAKTNNFYYVLVASANYKSADATTKVTLRNVANGNNSLGYGLIINSNPVPLVKDYAFLINTITLKYRIVTHTPGKEQAVVNWKSSKAIKSGSQENVLEVQDQDGQFKFFINGELVETLSSSDSYQNGVAGLYVGGMSPIAFSNLEIRK